MSEKTASRRFGSRSWLMCHNAQLAKRGERMCSGCGRTMPLTPLFWHANSWRSNGYQSECRECLSARHKRKYAARKAGGR
jgi:hypothetical protein